MKKKTIIVIEFIILASILSFNIYADRVISAANALYKTKSISLKDALDNDLGDINYIYKSGDATVNQIYKGKTGYSKSKFITGTMEGYYNQTYNISTVWKDGNRVKFNFLNVGYNDTTDKFKMTFGNKAEFKLPVYGYFTKKSVMSVPSSSVLTYVNLEGINTTLSMTKVTPEYADEKTFTAEPITGYYLDSATCTDTKGNVNVSHTLSGYEVGDKNAAWGKQTIKVKSTDNNTPLDSSCKIISQKRTFNITINDENDSSVEVAGSKVSYTNTLEVKYGETAKVTITPTKGYYVKSLTCTNGYTTNATVGQTFKTAKEITISNNSKVAHTTCTITMGILKLNVKINTSSVNASASNITITYGKTGSITISPISNYYISGASCTNGYKVNASTGTGAISGQTVKISNNGSIEDSTCTFSGHARSYPGTPVMRNCESPSCGTTTCSRNCRKQYVCHAGHEPCDPWGTDEDGNPKQYFNSTCCKGPEVLEDVCETYECYKTCMACLDHYDCPNGGNPNAEGICVF